jgi:surface protein
MKKLLLITTFLFTLTFYAQNNPDFYLDPNGVTCLCPEADLGDTGTLTINGVTKTFTKRSRAQLNALIDNDEQNPYIALTCTSGIEDMSNMFVLQSLFNQALNSWDVSNVTDMQRMFLGAYSFNQNINNWDVSNVTNMEEMFFRAISFDHALNSWDVSNVTNMAGIFNNTSDFNQPLDNWDVSQVTSMFQMFRDATSFNQPLDNWDVINVTDMERMFYLASSFNQPLNNWDVSKVTSMFAMFNDALVFNQDLSGWCVRQIPVEPQDFALNSALQEDFFPNWGAECNLSTTNPEAIGFNILIYPNPSNSKVFIKNDGQIILSKIKLIDMLGRDIKTHSASQITHGIDVSGIEAGNYFVHFTTVNDKQFVKRLIVN